LTSIEQSQNPVLFEQALKQAKELDDEFASTKKLRGPFHGVPFSVKVSGDSVTEISFTKIPHRINVSIPFQYTR
jgi:Asp-tRNA(Asn)/Glu-tRNA(Gln) amidotransferase A subunit family amidase